MSYGKALYFPYIHFQDENWLKHTLLYWDGLKRIVPPGYKPHDSELVKALISEGFIESVDPGPYTAAVADEFIPTLRELMSTRGHASRGETVAREVEANAQQASVHIQKMDERVADMLRSSGLAQQSGDWYAMDSGTAGYYMLCLAAHISEKQHAPMLSDSFEMETGGTYFQHSRIRSQNSQSRADAAAFTLARMVMPVPQPADLSALSVHQMIDFYRDHDTQRTQFRKAIEKVTNDAANLEDSTAVKDLLQQEKKRIKSALADQKKAIDEFGVGAAMSLMAVSVPSGLVVSALQHFDPVVTSVMGGFAVALSFIGWIAKTRQAKRKAVRDSDWHYLLSMEKSFDSKAVAGELQNSYRGFIYD
jgi:hypothetical protein